jgi:transcriptional regulator with XRE-family HTH domain
MDSIGSRLKYERIRLGLNQNDFGSIGGVQQGAQINYEKNVRSTSANYLQAAAKAGADIQFIITGNSGFVGSQISPCEAKLLESFRLAHGAVKAAVVAALNSANDYILNSDNKIL